MEHGIGLGYSWLWRPDCAGPLSPRSVFKPMLTHLGVLLADGLIRGLARPFEALFSPFPIVSCRCHRFATQAGVSSQQLNRIRMVRIEALISIKHILAMHNRRFPPPWSIEKLDAKSAKGLALSSLFRHRVSLLLWSHA